ncbi:hypothetical protein Bca4012_092789 [Brassica carinata]
MNKVLQFGLHSSKYVSIFELFAVLSLCSSSSIKFRALCVLSSHHGIITRFAVHQRSHRRPQRYLMREAFFSIFSAATLCFFGPPSSLIKDFRSTPEDFTRLPSWIPFQSNIAFRYHEITWYGEKIEEDPTGVSDSIRFAYSISQCDAVFVHSSPEFKPEYLGLLRDLYGKPVFPTGFLPTSTEDEVGDATWVGIKKWLDKQRVSSVVYAALGTEASHRPADHGLEKSEVPFFWVLRNDSQIPEGFVERIKGRGMVHNGWVPQVKILSHDSVGGFLTHCGWNSLVEGLGVERVPIFFPVLNEQGLNTRLVEGKGVGVEIPRDEKEGSCHEQHYIQEQLDLTYFICLWKLGLQQYEWLSYCHIKS